MWIYIWTTEPKSIYVWTTPVKEVYVGTTKVRPSEWKPWANTVAYRPLNSTTTVKDQSWNNYNLTQTGGSFGTYNGVNCFYNGGGTTGYFTLTSGAKIPSGNASRTILMRVCPTSVSSWGSRYIFSYGYNSTTSTASYGIEIYMLAIGTISDRNYRYSDWGWYGIWKTSVANEWALLNVVVSNSTLTFYNNGVKTAGNGFSNINTTAISNTRPLKILRHYQDTGTAYQFRWYISEVIIENKARTADEILAYYNQTKGNYWL